MRLRDWLEKNDFTDARFAAEVERRLPDGQTCASKTVEKWRYGSRTPRSKMFPIIAEITNNDVQPNDFLNFAKRAA